MKGRYITTQILLACLSKKPAPGKDIHGQLAETIAEYKGILEQFNNGATTKGTVLFIGNKTAA